MTIWTLLLLTDIRDIISIIKKSSNYPMRNEWSLQLELSLAAMVSRYFVGETRAARRLGVDPKEVNLKQSYGTTSYQEEVVVKLVCTVRIFVTYAHRIGAVSFNTVIRALD